MQMRGLTEIFAIWRLQIAGRNDVTCVASKRLLRRHKLASGV